MNTDNENDDVAIEEVFEFEILQEHCDQYKRIDQFLADKLENVSRTLLKKYFEAGFISAVSIEDLPEKVELKKMPPVGTKVIVQIPEAETIDAKPENIPIDILFEDEHLMIINKEAGMVVHPAPGNYSGTLVNAILFHCPSLGTIGDKKRPGIVHRLDKGTSGIMVVAKNQKAHEGLVKLFSTHDIERKYHCIAMGINFPVGGTIDKSIGRHQTNRLKMSIDAKQSKQAITHYRLLKQYDKCALLEMTLETGRTHQIRVHLSQVLKRPILADALYGNPGENLQRLSEQAANIVKNYPYPFLHARELGFVHPITQEKLFFEIEPPQVFQDVQRALENNE